MKFTHEDKAGCAFFALWVLIPFVVGYAFGWPYCVAMVCGEVFTKILDKLWEA